MKLITQLQSRVQKLFDRKSIFMSSPKIFIDKTYKELMKLFEHKTDLQINKALLAYKGKWMKSQVYELRDVWVTFGSVFVLTHVDKMQIVILRFDSTYEDYFASCSVGHKFRAIGMIGRVSFDSVTLENCELDSCEKKERT